MAGTDDIVIGYEFLATLDFKTCLVCAALDRKRFKRLEDVPAKIHNKCRCTVLPVTSLSDQISEDRPSYKIPGDKLCRLF